MRKLIVALLLITLPFAAAADECQFSAVRSSDIDAAGLKSLRANLGVGDLDIESAAGLSQIEVRGTACASDAARLKGLKIDASRRGDDAIINVSSTSSHNKPSLLGSTYAYLILKVRVPATLAVSAVAGSGSLNASGLASLDFISGSGSLSADHIKGTLTLKIGSAAVKAEQVGSVDLKSTGSGTVHVTGVQGDVHAAQSGSGTLGFSNVGGNVSVGNIGSGDLTLTAIGRNVDIISTASGDVTADDVGGNLTVHSTLSGKVKYAHVKGIVSVPKHADSH